jgi:protocadherin alpha
VSFSNVDTPGAKNIYEALKEEVFWTRVLIPLATIDFETLESELENQETPLSIQLRMFKIQAQSALQQEIEGLQASKKDSQEKVNSYIRAITDQKLNVHRLEETIREKTSIFEKGLVARSLEDEFKRILSLPYIEGVSFVGADMVITTGPIQIDDGPILGGYTITYGVKDKNLMIRNNVNPIRYYGLAHPHIYQDGEICFGNYSDIFFRFETGEYYVGLELLHEFLSTYNPEDEWGQRLIHWDAKYVFEDMRERGILNELDSEWDERYYSIYYEHLPSVNVCEDCGEPLEDCECHRCQYCNRHEDDCECWICPECGCEVGNDCRCDRCENCNELVGDCECERCDECGELLDPHNHFSNHCECERCPDDYDIFVDTDDEGCCTECENWDCDHNCNEHHAITQENSLLDDLEEAV